MAQQDYTGLIVIAGIGGLAWYGYQQGWFSGLFGMASTPASAPVTSSTPVIAAPLPVAVANPPQAIAPPPVVTPPSSPPIKYADLYSQLQSAAGTTTLNADQWSYYYGKLPGRTQLSVSDFGSLLSNMGVTDSSQPMALATFITGLHTLGDQGLSGLGFYSGIPVSAIHGGW